MTQTTLEATITKIEGAPGTGKSWALIREAVRRVQAGEVPPETVRILTTSPSHVEQLTCYLNNFCDGETLSSQALVIETFEQFCLQILQTFSPHVSPGSQLLSEQEAHWLLRQLGRKIAQERLTVEHPLFYAIQTTGFSRQLYPFIRQFQTFGISTSDLEQVLKGLPSSDDPENRLALVIEFQRRFFDYCQAHHWMTYRDLTEQTETLLRTNERVRQRVQRQYSLILIDEAQELSQRRFQLLRHLYPETQLVFSGNDRLCLTAFRGAAPDWFADLTLPFGENVPVTSYFSPNELTCYRNNEALLWWIGEWLEQKGYGKKLWGIPTVVGQDMDYKTQLQEQVHLGYFYEPEQEAQAIARELKALKKELGCPWQSMAILFRNNNAGESRRGFQTLLTQILLEHQIPVVCNGFPESLQRPKSLLFHALNVFELMEKLGLTELPEKSLRDESVLKASSLSVLEKMACLESMNQHLVSWLSLDTVFSEATDLLARMASYQADISNPLAGWTLIREYARYEHPLQERTKQFLSAMDNAYKHYLKTGQLFPLCQRIMEQAGVVALLSEETLALQGLGSFLQAIQSLDKKSEDKTPGDLGGLNGFSEDYLFFWPQEGGTQPLQTEEDAVQLKTIQQVQGKTFDVVFIPELTSDDFPRTTEEHQLFSIETSKALQSYLLERGHNPYTLPLGFDHAQHQAGLHHEAQLMTMAMSRAKKKLLLTSHQHHASAEGRVESVSPSVFFTDFLQAHPQLASLDSLPDLSKPPGWLTSVAETALEPEGLITKERLETETRTFYGHSDWAELPVQSPEPIYTAEECLSLSPSGISNYIACPRKFFYNQVLGILTESGKSAFEGTLIHCLLEVLNDQFPEEPYTAERLKFLTEAMFKEDTTLFKEKDFQKLRTYSPVDLMDFKLWILRSVDALEGQGYFNRTPKQILAERSFRFQSPHLPRVELNGKIDALIQYEDDTGKRGWDLLDYKTSRSAFGERNPDKRQEKLMQVFHPMGIEHDEQESLDSSQVHDATFGRGQSFGALERNYQIPLYYLATQQDSVFEEVKVIGQCGLQMVRPSEQATGAVQVAVSAETIEPHTDRLLADLERWVATPILNAQSFSANTGESCKQCGYREICDQAESEEANINAVF